MRAKFLPSIIVLVVATFAAAQQEKLGKVTFPTSCDPKVQRDFERGVAMLHSYWFIQARKTFEGVLEQDPSCAIAYWGVAMDLLGNTLVAPPPEASAKTAWEALQKARTVGAKTERERDWIEALAAYYQGYDKVPVNDRLLAYTKAMDRMTQRYPNDSETWIYYALTLQASAPTTDRSYSNQLKAAAILEKQLAKDPEHPGVAHYLIHAYDYPPLAEKGLPAARRYAGLAPAAPHARHMPSHIYSMLGLWEDSIASNQYAMEIQPDYYHAADFWVYANLQLARDAQARDLIDKASNTADTGTRQVTIVNFTALAAMPARYALERGDWKGAAGLPVKTTEFPAADSLTRFARGLGMVRSGDAAGAKGEIEAMRTLKSALMQSNQPYWAERTQEQIDAVSAWVALAEGSRDRARQLMRAAADSEDKSVKHVAMENRLYPMRELLGDLLLESGDAAAALVEYEAALKETPNRYRGLWGAARAAEASGDRRKAREYYGRLVALAKNADSARPEPKRAQAFLAQK